MPNIASLLKSEITRLARKELRLELEPLRRSAASARSEIAALKKQVRTLQVELRRTAKASRRKPGTEPAKVSSRFRFRSATLKAHRAKLGLSAKDYGLLLGASGLSIYKWEDDKAMPRANMLAKIAAVIKIGKREALRKLESLQSD